MITGNTIQVYLDGEAIAASRSCKLHHQCGTVETASATSATASEYIPGRTDWTITATWLVVSAAAMKSQLLRVRQIYNIRFGEGSTYLSGRAICTDAEVTASWGSLVQGSFKFKGTGPLT